MSRLLLESGGAFLLEDGTSYLLLELTDVVQTLDPMPIPRNRDWQSLSKKEIEKLKRIERKLRALRAAPEPKLLETKLVEQIKEIWEVEEIAPQRPVIQDSLLQAVDWARNRDDVLEEDEELLALEMDRRHMIGRLLTLLSALR